MGASVKWNCCPVCYDAGFPRFERGKGFVSVSLTPKQAKEMRASFERYLAEHTLKE